MSQATIRVTLTRSLTESLINEDDHYAELNERDLGPRQISEERTRPHQRHP